jgi:AP-5 complex subunit zeta-1
MTEGGDGGGGAGGDERDWAIWLRLLSHSVRDTAGSASTDDTAVLQAVRKLHELCKIEGSGDLVARVYPSLTKLFQRCCASVVSSQRSSTGLLLLVRLFFLSLICFPNHDQKLASVSDFQLTLLRRCCCSSVSNLSLSLVGML